jgi:dienelactone hydrolase
MMAIRNLNISQGVVMKAHTRFYVVIFSAFGLWASIAMGAKLDLGAIDPSQMLESYPDFDKSLSRAMVGVPGSMLASGKDFYGHYEDLQGLDFVKDKKAPVVVYMHGSGQAIDRSGDSPKLKWDYGYGEWVTQAGYIFVAPDSYGFENRPSFSSPVPKENYEQVHNIRQAEVAQAARSLVEQEFANTDEMYLLGVSEGAMAAARYHGKEFKGRLVLSWSCEPGYFTDYPKVGASSKAPFLNIMGARDFYFGKDAPYSTQYAKNTGNCAAHLSAGNFNNARVIVYPESGHGVTYNQYMKSDLLGFLSYWVGRPIE